MSEHQLPAWQAGPTVRRTTLTTPSRYPNPDRPTGGIGSRCGGSRLAQRPAAQPPTSRLSDRTVRRLAAGSLVALVAPLLAAGAVVSGARPADAMPALLSRPGPAAAAASVDADPVGEGAATTSTTDPLSGSPIVGSPLDSLSPSDSQLEGSGLREGGLDDPDIAARVAAVLHGLAPTDDRFSNSRTKGN